MCINKSIVCILSALLISIGIFAAGQSISKAAHYIKSLNRVVTVKGLAEQDVKSDLGVWEINYREIGSDLIALDQKLLHDQQVVTDFLKQQGFEVNEISRTQFRIEDRMANLYNQNQQAMNDQRYVVTAGLRVRSTKVNLIENSVQEIDKLLQQGVPLTFDIGNLNPNPSYYFTKLDDIRPKMLADATQSAHTVALQFAKDSGSTLYGIQRANQGVFQIMNRDTSTMSADWNTNINALGSIDKKVRLVTTIDYRLK